MSDRKERLKAALKQAMADRPGRFELDNVEVIDIHITEPRQTNEGVQLGRSLVLVLDDEQAEVVMGAIVDVLDAAEVEEMPDQVGGLLRDGADLIGNPRPGMKAVRVKVQGEEPPPAFVEAVAGGFEESGGRAKVAARCRYFDFETPDAGRKTGVGVNLLDIVPVREKTAKAPF